MACHRTEEQPEQLFEGWTNPHLKQLGRKCHPPFVMGRKNWLFCNTPDGAQASAAIYSIVETAKANGLELYKYLKYLLEQLPRANGRYSHELWSSLAPWSEMVQKHC